MDINELTRPGVHFITEPIRLGSGTHLAAEPGSRLVGGVELRAKAAGAGLWFCDLRAAGIEPAKFVSRGFGRKISPSHSELFINGTPMRISRYPKRDFLKITGVGEPGSNEWSKPIGELAGGFYYEDSRPKAWRDQEVWVFGYWAWDWAPTRERIDEFDKERGFIRCCPPYGQYSYTVGQRFCFFNIVEEVTEPGEYAVDFEAGRLWFIPPEGVDPADAEILLSMSDRPAFIVENAEDSSIEGFRIECFRSNAIEVRNSKDVKISGCELCNIGNRAVVIEASERAVVSDCHIHDTGDGGAAIWGGDRATLRSCGCGVENCHIHHVAAWDRCYEPPIKLTGVGLFARGNRIHDCPHTAVLYGGNDIEIKDNEIWRVVLETGDAGAIYAGRDYTMRGNVVEGNFLHHIGSGIGMGTMGVYNDDCLSGTVMRNNVFYKVQRALFLGGGVDFVCEGNVFIGCTPGIEIDGRGQSDHAVWRNMVARTMRDRFYNVDGLGVSAAEPPYIERYPELARIDAYYRSDDAPHIPPSARIAHNSFVLDPTLGGEQKIKLTWNTEGGQFDLEDNQELTLEELDLTARQREVISGK